jgi:hypothetical protein
MIVEVSLTKLFKERFFSICQLDSVIKLVGSRKAGDAYNMLCSLHCVDYSEMPAELRNRIPALVGECLSQSSGVTEAVNTVLGYLDKPR